MKKLVSEAKGDVLVIYPPDYINLSFKQSLISNIENGWADAPKTFLLNMEKVELINSHGAAAILELYNFLNKHGQSLAICCVREMMVEDMCRDTGILFLCEGRIYKEEKDALDALSKHSE